MNHGRVLMAAGLLCLVGFSSARADLLTGIGVMGESFMDESQFYTQDPGDRSYTRGMVEILANHRSLNFGEFTTDPRPSPRFQGYEYNWARTRSTAASSFDLGPNADFRPLTDLGQHTGLAGQVADGDVTLTTMFIGSNDFLRFFLTPVEDPGAALSELVPNMMNNTAEAATTVLGANDQAKMVVFTLPDVTVLPAARGSVEQAISEGRITREQADELLAGIRAATDGFNDGILQLADAVNQQAGESRLAVADFHGMVDEVFETDDPLVIGDIEIDKFAAGTGIEHLFTPDGIHTNTPFHGLLANLFIDTINAEFGAGVDPLNDGEILGSTAVVPEPGSLSLLAVAAAGAILLRRRRSGRVILRREP